MIHSPIQLKAISLTFAHKTCFENFTAQIHFGARIALMGDNGCGKSSLLRMIVQYLPENAQVGFVPQIIENLELVSGAERFNRSLTEAISLRPNILILDEPTNHLDEKNRKSLLRFLQNFTGTIIVASHDVELLESMNTLWHIHLCKIHVFSGNYTDYVQQIKNDRSQLTDAKKALKKERQNTHLGLMQEQERAAKSKAAGKKNIQNRKWPTIVSHSKASRGIQTAGRKNAEIAQKRVALELQMADLYLTQIIKPTFSLRGKRVHSQTVVEIRQGHIGYGATSVLRDIHLSLFQEERMALVGNNGSGKSTLLKAILGTENVRQSGYWHTPAVQQIGYLDQHYQILNQHITVIDLMRQYLPQCDDRQIRNFLSDFLFRQHAEVEALVSTLSSGEKARLSLALIAAQEPELLLLDEVTNNLDLQTKQHVIEVLQVYPGAMIVVSHEKYFLQALKIKSTYAAIKS